MNKVILRTAPFNMIFVIMILSDCAAEVPATRPTVTKAASAGGYNHDVSDKYDWAAGSLLEDN
jgi:hypothetical protein